MDLIVEVRDDAAGAPPAVAGRARGRRWRVGEALFHAHSPKGATWPTRRCWWRRASAGGLPGGRVRTLPAGNEGAAEVRRGGAAQAMGIHAVPTFVIDGRFAVQGAQAPDLFAQALRQAAGEAGLATARPGGADCGPAAAA